MPKAMHRRLAARASRMGLKGSRKDAYIYGTMAKLKKRKRNK